MCPAFLTILDQFSGVIFLTSNRVGLIDEALKGRIHVALPFTRLDEYTILKIWKNELNYLREVDQVRITTAPILRWARRHTKQCLKQGTPWNGNMIRNALQVATAVALEAETYDDDYDSSSRESKNDTEDDNRVNGNLTRISERDLEYAAGLTDSFNGYCELMPNNAFMVELLHIEC
jgi:hypothetical protein